MCAVQVESGCNEYLMSVMQNLLVIPVIDRQSAKLVRDTHPLTSHRLVVSGIVYSNIPCQPMWIVHPLMI